MRKASSPVAQAQMHDKSGNELMSLTQLSRTFGWSSTKATLIGRFEVASAERLSFVGFVILTLGGVMVW
jgi:hypothetical protein